MNINQLKSSLPVMMKHNIVPCLHGFQGTGKTQVYKQIAEMLRWGFVKLNLATQEVGDLVGLLVHEGRNVRHACPEWLPTKEAVAEGRFPENGILFLDEINRAHPDVIQAMFPFLTDRTIHTHELAPGWKIGAAANFGDDMTLIDTSDAAWMSRFCHLEFKPTAAEFVAYAESRDADTVADFISEHSEMLEQKGRKGLSEYITVTPDRRAWLEMIAPLENESLDNETRMMIYTGIIGMTAASRFITFKTTKERRLRLRDILKDYSKVKDRVLEMNKAKDTRYDALSAPIQELEAKVAVSGFSLSGEEVENLKQYFLDVPKELLAQTTKKLGRANFGGKNELLNDLVFAKRFFK